MRVIPVLIVLSLASTAARGQLPEIHSVSPTLASDPQDITITGQNFDDTSAVSIEGVPARVLAQSPTQLTVSIPPGTPGFNDVTVSNSIGAVTLFDASELWPSVVVSGGVLGGQVGIDLDNGGPGLYIAAIGLAGLPSPVPVLPTIYYGILLDPASLVHVTEGPFDSGGQSSIQVSVPADPSLKGLGLHVQALCQQGIFTGTTFSFSNAATVTLQGFPKPPSNFVYANDPVSYEVDLPIDPNVPSYDGSVDLFTVSPALPDGLTLDPVTGVIDGTPTAQTAMAGYTVTASNPAGSTTSVVDIEITGSGGTTASGDLLVGDAAVEDLSSFRATITSAVLVTPGGGSTSPSFLESPETVEFLGLGSSFAWIASETFPTDMYAAVRMSFDPSSYEAKSKSGAAVVVSPVADTFDADFVTTFVPDAGEHFVIMVDLDLEESLSGDVGTGTISFDPTGTATFATGTVPVEIDEIDGTVVSADAASETFVVDGSGAGLGNVTVDVSGSPLLLAGDGTAFPDTASFFAALTPGTTQVEVHGSLGQSSVVSATRVDIEDTPVVVKIEGIVVGIDEPSPPTNGEPLPTFDVLITEVEKGEDVVESVLAKDPSPEIIAVSWDASTVFVGLGGLTTSDDLAVGKEVKVKFETFATEPFSASKVTIEDEHPRFEGLIIDVTGLPLSFVFHLDEDEPALISGDVESSTTDVTVNVTTSTVFLDVEGEPAVAVDDVATGMEATIRGALAGTPAAPTLDAASFAVEPGKLTDATVELGTADPVARRFGTSGGTIDEPFGNDLGTGPAPPLTVEIHPTDAAFTGDATTEAEFFTLVDNLVAGEALLVRVRGISAGPAATVTAYRIRSEVVQTTPE